jgi:hypothetical protein
MIKFKDITSHPHGAKDRTPKSWEAEIGCVRLRVTRHIHYGADQWIATSVPYILDMELLQSKDIDEAKAEAIALLSARCNAIVLQIEKR